MSDIELLPVDGSELPGFSPEPAGTDPPCDLAISDGVSGLGGNVTLSDENGASEFGADEAAVPDVAAAQTEAGDDDDLLGDPEEPLTGDGAIASGSDEVAGPDDAELAESMQRMDADLAEITGLGGGSDQAVASEDVARTGTVDGSLPEADAVVTEADPDTGIATAQADPAVIERAATASGRPNADSAGGEAAADEALSSGSAVAPEQHIGRVAAGASYQIFDTGSSGETAGSGYAADRSVATLDRPHVGDRYYETDQLRGRTAGERARLQQLEGLPHTGFTSSEIKQVRAQIAALGYPVDNFRQFTHKHNERGTEDTIASWLGHGHGEFTVYDLYDRQIPEKRLGTLSHETAHANSPLKPENEAVYGQDQQAAAQFVNRVAQQSLLTNVHLNGYHKYLMNEYRTNMGKLTEEYSNGHISDAEMMAAQAEVERKFNEETWAIMNEMALTNRAGLADVETRQFRALARLADQEGQQIPSRVALISDAPTEDQPNPTTYGIDRWLIHLIDGVNDQQDLVRHVATLKQRFYGASNNERAAQRVQRRYAQAA